MLNAQHPAPVKVNGEDLPTTEEFTNLGSIVRLDGGAGNDIKNRLSKPRNAFRMKNNAWRLSQYSNKAKRRLYQNVVLSTLLYGSECWRMTECDRNKSSNFHTKYLRRTLRIFWPETISKQQLLPRFNQESMEIIIMRRRWGWIGHVTHREQGSITRTALLWAPEGKRKRGRRKNTWRRTVEGELKPYSVSVELFRRWPRKDRSGDPLFLPYMPDGIHGHEWVSEWYLPTLSVYYVGINKDIGRRLPQLHCIKMKFCDDPCFIYFHFLYFPNTCSPSIRWFLGRELHQSYYQSYHSNIWCY